LPYFGQKPKIFATKNGVFGVLNLYKYTKNYTIKQEKNPILCFKALFLVKRKESFFDRLLKFTEKNALYFLSEK